MKRFSYIFLLCIALLQVSCEFKSKGVFTDDSTEKYQLYDYYIDEYGNEGIVAYIYSGYSGREYMIVISLDESYQPWGPMGEMVYKTDSVTSEMLQDPSFGVAVHQAMWSAGMARYPAQAWCDAKNNGERYPRAGSWRLPTFHELRLLFDENKDRSLPALNAALAGVGGTTVNSNNLYWTCVEDFNGYITFKSSKSDYDRENRAVITSPTNSSYTNKDRWLKKNKYYVRAIKYVYYSY